MLIIALFAVGTAQAFTPPPITWTTPSTEPGTNKANQPVISGGMPLGNGETVAAVFPLVHPAQLPASAGFDLVDGSVSFFVSMSTAMASDTSLFKLGMVSLTTTPSLFSGDPASFTQTLDLATATVTVATDIGTARVWVDANANRIVATVDAAPGGGAPLLDLVVRVQSVHPNRTFSYGGGFGLAQETCGPDVFEPAPLPGRPGAVVISHRNEDSDVPAAFNETLVKEGLAALVPELQASDRWRHRQFGMAVDGGPALARVNASALASATPARSFTVAITTHANQTDTHAAWLAQLGTAHDAHAATGTSTAKGAHDGWWTDFWNRSWITPSSSAAGGGLSAADATTLARQYAVTRFVNAVQSGTWVPISP